MVRILAGLWLGVVLAGVTPQRGFAQANGTEHVYLTREQALKEVFPKSVQYVTETVALT